MALKNCPECNNMISEKALFCPHCGYVIDGKKIKKVRNSLIVRIDGGKMDVLDLFMMIFLLGIFAVIAIALIVT